MTRIEQAASIASGYLFSIVAGFFRFDSMMIMNCLFLYQNIMFIRTQCQMNTCIWQTSLVVVLIIARMANRRQLARIVLPIAMLLKSARPSVK